ncbi:MAG: DUF1367 family protein [Proteobacteria bacterium]|nr:DUF1367 family protein [Pseudomonadota bacterium]
MSEAYLMKTPGGYVVDRGDVPNVKIGEVIKGNFTKPRNYKFLQKYFALLDIAFDAWEPEEKEYNGEVAEKNRDRFRHDIAILTGFYNATYNINGELRLEAKSISFASMNEEDFEKLYNATVDLLLKRILTNYTKDDVNTVVDSISGFA